MRWDALWGHVDSWLSSYLGLWLAVLRGRSCCCSWRCSRSPPRSGSPSPRSARTPPARSRFPASPSPHLYTSVLDSPSHLSLHLSAWWNFPPCRKSNRMERKASILLEKLRKNLALVERSAPAEDWSSTVEEWSCAAKATEELAASLTHFLPPSLSLHSFHHKQPSEDHDRRYRNLLQ